MDVTPTGTPGLFLLGSAPAVEPDLTWLPGRGVPQVVIDDPQEVLQMVTAGEVRSDYTVTIREVD